MDTRGSRDASDVEPSCEGDAHQAWTGQRRTPATMVLVVTMVALYLVEAGLGAPDYVPALVRLGALVRERVLAGEIWRLVSCTFLHGSVMHLAFNMVVLWSLGQMLERILGTARFIVMYVAAGIGGSLLSLVFLKGVSVGASGALWGLMTAEMVLIWRARHPARGTAHEDAPGVDVEPGPQRYQFLPPRRGLGSARGRRVHGGGFRVARHPDTRAARLG